MNVLMKDVPSFYWFPFWVGVIYVRKVECGAVPMRECNDVIRMRVQNAGE